MILKYWLYAIRYPSQQRDPHALVGLTDTKAIREVGVVKFPSVIRIK